MKKSRKRIFRNFSIALGIILCSFSLYFHDLEFFKGRDGFSGFSSLRIGLWVTSMFIVSLVGWIGFFMKSKGSDYRFAILAPIFMLSFQLGIYLFDARNTTTNELSTKIWLNIGFVLLLAIVYFIGKSKNVDEE